MTEPTENPLALEPGFYFDLPEETYFRLPYLSASSIKALRRSDMDAWQDGPWNWRPRTDTGTEESKAFKMGRAWHLLVFQGEEGLKSEFFRKPHKDDFPDALDTQAHLSKWLEDHDCAKSGSKAVQIARILEHCKTYEIEPPQILALEIDAVADPNKQSISTADWDRMMRQYELFKAELSLLIPQPGAAEVTVIFDFEGVRCKARIDWLSANTFCDLKTFANSRGKQLEDAVTSYFAFGGIDVQMVLYGLGLKLAAKSPRPKHLPYSDEPNCLLLFLQTDTPNLVPRTFDVHDYDGLAAKALHEIREACAKWKALLERGHERPWNLIHETKPISIQHLPSNYIDE